MSGCRLLVFHCGLWLLWATSLGSAVENKTPPLLAITDLRTISEDTTLAEATSFSEFIRQEIESTGLYRVISRSSMMSILKAKSFPLPCYELPCFTDMGRLLGADQVLAGHLQRHGSSLEVNLRLIDVKQVRFIKTVYRSFPQITSEELLGQPGLEILAEIFNIDIKLLLEGKKTLPLPKPKPLIQEIPDAIKNKYPGMVYIPEGEALIGSNDGDVCEQPVHRQTLKAFYIGKFEVTNNEYAEFVKAAGYHPPVNWSGGAIPPGLENHPVTLVTFEDAEAYCQWKGARLPTEAEWERAARGAKNWVYPFGDTFDPNLANTWEAGRGGTSPAGSYYQGASPFGAEDMCGNVYEWVADFFEPYPNSKTYLEDYDKHLRILKGGSWNFNSYYARISHRFARSGGEKGRSYGFRIARNP